MSETTGISWCDSTLNGWIGCTKVSPGCDHCYAEADFDKRRHVVNWGAGQPRHRTTEKNWNQALRWNAKPFYECEQCGWRGEDGTQSSRLRICMNCGTGTRLMPTRRRVFSFSLADWLDNEVPIEWLVDFLNLVRSTPNLDWLLLSKRIGNWRKRVEEAAQHLARGNEPDVGPLRDWIARWLDGTPPLNVWIGASIVNQEEADRDIPKLLTVPSHVRFLSMEPLLGAVDLRFFRDAPLSAGDGPGAKCLSSDRLGLHWVIVGGESGKKARPMHPHWARSLVWQCAAAGVPVLFKQVGEYSTHEVGADGELNPPMSMTLRGLLEWREDLQRFAEPATDATASEVFKPGAVLALPVGAKVAGDLLDGVRHQAWPKGGAAWA